MSWSVDLKGAPGGTILNPTDTGFTDFGYTGQRNLGDIGLMDYTTPASTARHWVASSSRTQMYQKVKGRKG